MTDVSLMSTDAEITAAVNARPDFQSFGKIPRLLGDMVVTEKIDGTNACLVINPAGVVFAQSRNRFITPEDDNYGFAAWAVDHADDLAEDLGPGYHFGEWWGQGVQKRYTDHIEGRRFSLFNVARWGRENPTPRHCHVVPVLYEGPFNTARARSELLHLLREGSQAAPGCMNPEGVMVWHERARQMFKYPADPAPKGAQ